MPGQHKTLQKPGSPGPLFLPASASYLIPFLLFERCFAHFLSALGNQYVQRETVNLVTVRVHFRATEVRSQDLKLLLPNYVADSP